MSSWTRLFIRDRETPSSRVRIRHEIAVPADADGNNGDVCIVASGSTASVYVHTAGAWTEIGSGPSSASANYFDPLAEPATPHASDDEFNGSSLDAAWTEWEPGTPTGFSVTVANSQVEIVTETYASSTTNLAGIHRAAPSGDWSAWAKISVAATGVTASAHDHGGGIFVASSDIVANPTTADVTSWILSPRAVGTATLAYILNWNAYNSYNGSSLAMTLPAQTTSIWQRVRYASGSTTLSFDISADGIGWQQVFTTASPFITPQRIGFLTRASDGTSIPSPVFRADFLRFAATADYDALTLGKVV